VNTPPIRVIPPSPGQLAADVGAPWMVFVRRDAHEPRFGAAANRYRELAERPLMLFEEGSWYRLVGERDAVAEFAGYLKAIGHPAGDLIRRALRPAPAWQLRTRSLPLDRPHIMAILNLTDDSFSGDGLGRDAEQALKRAEELREAGASLIDVGAESARADRPVLEAVEEAKLVAEAVAALVREGHVVSVDTYKPEVAAAALDSGAEVVNDISGLTIGSGAAEAAAKAGAGYVLNYSFSPPKERPERPPTYADVVSETLAWMFERLEDLAACGLPGARVAVDPGIAFGKSHDEDLQVLRRIGELGSLGHPVLLAHSRKNFIGSVNGSDPRARDLETHVATALAFEQGVRVFRVHDVEGTRRALEMAEAIVARQAGDFAHDAESWPWRAGASAPHSADGAPQVPPPKGQRW